MLRNKSAQRLSWLVVGVTGLFSVLFFRAVDLQVVHGQTYLKQADNNRFYTHRILAQRGVFLDRYNQPLVWNIPKYFVVKDPGALYEDKYLVGRDEALAIIASSSAESVVTANERSYRYGETLSHVLGYVGDVTAEDLQRDETRAVGQQIGKAGLEYTQEKVMRGRDGQAVYEVNAQGRRQRQVSEVPAQSGQNVATTLDPYLSIVAESAFGHGKGGVIITDATTGQVLTLVSKPGFDPNLLSQTQVDREAERARREKVQQLFNDPQQLFFNRLVAGAYPPGSIFKLVTALSGLGTGHLDTSTTVNDQGVLKVGEYEYGNWYYRQYGRVEGTINLERAIARSNDIFFYKVAEWTGPNAIAEVARQFGFGQKTGIELPAEARGLVPDTAWKEKALNERWYLGDTYHYGIGQGNLLTTPVQIAQFSQALANQGSLCNLTLLAKDEVRCQKMNLKDDDLKVILQGMVDACSPGGTAFPFFPYNAKKIAPNLNGFELLQNGAVGCKTGTAEFGAANEKDYRKTHGWFTSVIDLSNWKRQMASQSAVTLETATNSAQLQSLQTQLPTAQRLESELHSAAFHQEWVNKWQGSTFPDRITITVLKESDEENPYREGSADAAPVAKQIVDWIVGK